MQQIEILSFTSKETGKHSGIYIHKVTYKYNGVELKLSRLSKSKEITENEWIENIQYYNKKKNYATLDN